MSEDNSAFFDLLADCTEQCASLDLSDDKWMPPDAEYLFSLTEVKHGISDKEGVKNIWIKPIFTIQDEGEFQNKTFSDFFYFSPTDGSNKSRMGQRGLLRLATCIAGTETKNPVEAIQVLEDACGEFLTGQVYRTVGKKGGTFTNVRYLTKVESTEAE